MKVNTFQPKSEEDFIKEIDLSLEQGENGQTKNAFASLQNIADKIEQSVEAIVASMQDEDVTFSSVNPAEYEREPWFSNVEQR